MATETNANDLASLQQGDLVHYQLPNREGELNDSCPCEERMVVAVYPPCGMFDTGGGPVVCLEGSEPGAMLPIVRGSRHLFHRAEDCIRCPDCNGSKSHAEDCGLMTASEKTLAETAKLLDQFPHGSAAQAWAAQMLALRDSA